MSLPTAQSRVYISGKITGNPGFKRQFDAAEDAVAAIVPGCGIVNPTDNFGGDEGRPRHEYFRIDFRQLVECSHILLLDGWEQSQGARAELIAAMEMGMGALRLAQRVGGGVELEEFEPTISHRAGWLESSADGPKSVCAEADAIVDGARRDDYGHPRDNLEQTARLWQEVLPVGRPLNGQDVSLMMILLKISRMCHRPIRDNWVDICGYAKCGDMCGGGDK